MASKEYLSPIAAALIGRGVAERASSTTPDGVAVVLGREGYEIELADHQIASLEVSLFPPGAAREESFLVEFHGFDRTLDRAADLALAGVVDLAHTNPDSSRTRGVDRS